MRHFERLRRGTVATFVCPISFSFAVAAATVVSASALADVTLTSSDGRWVATVCDYGGGAGQCSTLRDTTLAPQHQHFVAETIHYARTGSSLLFASAKTKRMALGYTMLSFAHDSESFTAVLSDNGFPGLVAMVNGEMIPGPGGGLAVSIGFVRPIPPASPLAATVIKPFVYVNMNVDNDMLSNIGGFTVDRFWQTSNVSGTNSIRWFRGRDIDQIESREHSLLRDKLDAGTTDLANIAMNGPTDINTAINWASRNLSDGAVYTVAYMIGNQGATIPDGFGLLPVYNSRLLKSVDDRWAALTWTGGGASGSDHAGAVGYMYDNSIVSASIFASKSIAYVAAGAGNIGDARRLSDTFTRIGFFSASTPRRATVVMHSHEWPGLVSISDMRMVPGDHGGLVTCMKLVDTTGAGYAAKPIIYTDLDVDAQAPANGGDFEVNRFRQWAIGSVYGSERWFRSTAFSSYRSGQYQALAAMLDAGETDLGDVVEPGPEDLAAAIAFAEFQLSINEPYAVGYAIGDAGIAIPAEFCDATISFDCPGDINGDGVVDGGDLGLLLSNWGPWSPTSPATDLNEDGMTDGADLGLLLAHWGPCR